MQIYGLVVSVLISGNREWNRSLKKKTILLTGDRQSAPRSPCIKASSSSALVFPSVLLVSLLASPLVSSVMPVYVVPHSSRACSSAWYV